MKQAGDRERGITHDLRVSAETGPACEEPVGRVALDQGRRRDRRLLVGAAGDDGPEQVFVAPAILHEVDREPVEQVAVFRYGRARAEVLGGVDETNPEHGLPDAVDGDARGERRLRRDDPAGELQTVAGRAFRPRVERRGHMGRDLVLRFIPAAAIEQFRRPGLNPAALREVKDGGAGDRKSLPKVVGLDVELFRFGDGSPPGAEDCRALFPGAFGGRGGEGEEGGVVHRLRLRVGIAGEGNAAATERRVVAAVVVAAVVHPQEHLEFGARGQGQRLGELHDGDRG